MQSAPAKIITCLRKIDATKVLQEIGMPYYGYKSLS